MATEPRPLGGTARASDERNKRARDEGRSAPEPHGRGRVHSSRSNEPPKSTNEWKELFRNLSIADLTGRISVPTPTFNDPEKGEVHGPPELKAAGGYGQVYVGYYTPRHWRDFGQCGSNLKVAAKRTNPKGEKVRSISLCDFGRRSARKFMTLNPLQHLVSELRIWSFLGSGHPNILPLLGCAFLEDFKWEHPVMVSEWVGDDSLKYLLTEFDRETALSLVSLLLLRCVSRFVSTIRAGSRNCERRWFSSFK